MSDPLLAVDKLEVVYQRAITAVQGISLAVPQGQIVGVLGTNGAGKTTLLRAISGFHGIDDAHTRRAWIEFGWFCGPSALLPQRRRADPAPVIPVSVLERCSDVFEGVPQ
jgi:ABC-type Mn2+/Zn2+ transport system ATPase subunit